MQLSFQLVAGHIALDFANTLDWRFDPERRIDLLQTYERLIQFAIQTGTISPAQGKRLLSRTRQQDSSRALRRAIRLREVVDALFRSIATGHLPRQDDLRTLNALYRDLQIPEFVVRKGSDFALWPGDFSDRADGPLWPIVGAAVRLLTCADRMHVRECGDQTCRWLFLDTSKNQSRQWCSMQICGNRAKVRRYRTRQSAT
jgi:predicted RNA-binding Zn ribbon-like protein